MLWFVGAFAVGRLVMLRGGATSWLPHVETDAAFDEWMAGIPELDDPDEDRHEG